MLEYPDEKYSLHCSLPMVIESSVDDALWRPRRALALRDLVLGASGSLLAHILLVLATLMWAFGQPPRSFPGSFVTVSLVNSDNMAGGSGNPGSSDASGRGGRNGSIRDLSEVASTEIAAENSSGLPKGAVDFEQLFPEPTQTENLITDDRLKAPKIDQTAAAKQRLKQAASPPQRKPQISPKPFSTEPIGVESPPTVQGPAADTAGTGSNPEKGVAGGDSQSAGAMAPGGSSLGTGSNRGELNANAVDQLPQVLKKVEPLYPRKARHLSVTGKVVVKFLVEADGQVTKPSILEAHPEGYFEENALEAIRRWRFKPGIYRGKAVATWVTLPVQFRLTDGME